MPARRFQRIARALFLVIGCIAFGNYVLIEHTQAQPGYVPPSPPPPPPVFNPSSPYTVPQPSYTPLAPSTPSTPPSIPSTVPSPEVTSPTNEEPASTTARSERKASAATKHHRVTHAHPAIYNTAPAARSDDVPTLDVNPVCHGIASQSELDAGLQQTNFQQCVKDEQATREQIKKEWSTFTAADKSHCVSLAKTGGESSYTELITCMEMARDVRELQKNANSLPEQNIPPAPVGHRQPTR